MLSNFDIEEIVNYYQIPIVVVMKDELKNMIKAIAKKPQVFAFKSWISLVLYDRWDFVILLQKVIISSGGNIPYESK